MRSRPTRPERDDGCLLQRLAGQGRPARSSERTRGERPRPRRAECSPTRERPGYGSPIRSTRSRSVGSGHETIEVIAVRLRSIRQCGADGVGNAVTGLEGERVSTREPRTRAQPGSRPAVAPRDGVDVGHFARSKSRTMRIPHDRRASPGGQSMGLALSRGCASRRPTAAALDAPRGPDDERGGRVITNAGPPCDGTFPLSERRACGPSGRDQATRRRRNPESGPRLKFPLLAVHAIQVHDSEWHDLRRWSSRSYSLGVNVTADRGSMFGCGKGTLPTPPAAQFCHNALSTGARLCEPKTLRLHPSSVRPAWSTVFTK